MLRRMNLAAIQRGARLLATEAKGATGSRENRVAALVQYRELVGPLYPYYEGKLAATSTLSAFAKRFDALQPGERRDTEQFTLSGRITAKRSAGTKLVFYDIATSEGQVQVVANEGAQSDALFETKHRALRRGDIASFSGVPGKTKSGQVSLFAKDASLLTPCLHDIPQKFTDPERRVRERYLDLLVNDQVHKSLRLRAKVIRFVRDFLDKRDFLEVETPILSAKAGGAHARPFITHSNSLDEDLHMRIAPELYLKQLVIGGMDRVYEIGKVFRNEGVDATHNPEFTSCEFYQAYSSFDELVKLTEDLVSQLVFSVHGTLKVRVPSKNAPAAAPGESDTDNFPLVDFTPPFQRLSFMGTLEEKMGTKLPPLDSEDAIPTLLHLCRKHGLSTDAPHTLAVLLDRLAGEFIEPLCVNPTFLMDHPLAMSPLAKKHPTDPNLSSRFELFVAKQEICNAYTELNSPHEQRERFVEQMRDRDLGDVEAPPTDEDFCLALEYGLPPTVGWGMGIDRMVMLLAQTPHIRNVLAFPLSRTQTHSAPPVEV